MKRLSNGAFVGAIVLVAGNLHAQDSLRVLRPQSFSVVTPIESFVVTFDHPVAPRLDQSVDPGRVVRIVPEVGARKYWRDPSTIVVEFDSAWAAGANYEVYFDHGLRSVDGLRLAATPVFHVHVPMPRAYGLAATSGGEADTVLRPLAVYGTAFDLSMLAGHAWFVPRSGCATLDSLPIAVTKMRRLSSTDPSALTEGNYERDRRLDSLRRVVELSVPGYVKRGCHGEIHLPLMIGQADPIRVSVAVRPAFALEHITCAAPNCERGPVVLRFTNAVTAAMVRAHVRVDGRPANYESDEPSTTITLRDQIRARQSVRITVDSGMKSTVGEPLRRETTTVLTGRPFAPAVGFANGVISTPRDAAVLMRVRLLNTDSVVVVIARVPDSLRAQVIAQGEASYYYSSLRWASIARDTVVRAIPTVAPEDSERVIDLPLTLVPPAWRDDPLLLVRVFPVGAPTTAFVTTRLSTIVVPPVLARTTPRYAVIRRSNLAVHARAADGIIDVWVTSLRDASARSGAAVRLLDNARRVLATAVTDARGRARLSITTPVVQAQGLVHLEVAYGDDQTLLVVANGSVDRNRRSNDDSPSLSYWWMVDQPSRIGTRWLHGSAFTDRGIYRPGERVYFGGVARTFAPDEGYRIPAVDSARWTVWHRDDESRLERVWSHTGRLSDFGTLTDSFTIDRTARLGEYVATLAVRGDSSWRTAARTEFRVAEYRAPEFAVRLDPDTSTMVFGGDSASVRVDARYLFGLPMAGGSVVWWSNAHEVQPWELHIPGLDGFTVGRWSWTNGEAANAPIHHEGTGTMSGDGTIRLRIPTDTVSRPASVGVTISVADVNRQTVTSETTIPVHATNAYVGMRTRVTRWNWKPRDSITVELVLVKPNGEPRSGEKVRVMALEYRWPNGKLQQDTVWRTTVTSASAPVSVTFVPREGGYYEIVGEAHDERGRRAITGLGIWVTGGNGWWYAPSPRTISMRTDRPRYAAGDTASVIVESPAEQRAWLTVGHEGMLSEQFVALHAGVNDVRVEIPRNAAREVSIRMMAVRPFGQGAGEDSAGIYHRSGALTVEVDTASRSLRVIVSSDRPRYSPRDSVHVGIDVRTARGDGRMSDLTVWAVDEGVVALTAFVRPAVLASLLAGSGDSPWSGSTLLAWMQSMPPGVAPAFVSEGEFDMLQGRVGAIRIRGASTLALSANVMTGLAIATGDAPMRTRFATTPFFTGRVHTDKTGHATTTFMLPDNVTAFRIYAVAIGDDVAAGSGDTSIISTRDLVVRPALPRIVRAGDELFAGAVLTKEGMGRVPVSLSVETTNAQVLGSATLRDTLDGQRSRELRFPLRVTGGDSVTFNFRGSTLSGATANDAVEAKLVVSPPGRARAHVVTGMLDRADVATLAMPAGTDTARSRVSLQLGVSPLPLVRQFSEALRIYPYYCTEQVSSAGRSLLARMKLERAINSAAVMTERDRTQLETGVATLVGRQRSDGGFGYWSETNWTSPWLTAYALEFLLGAKDAGIAVPDGSMTQARRYLDSVRGQYAQMRTDAAVAWRDSVTWPHDALATATMLRRVGAPDSVLERRVWDLRERLGFEDRLTLAALSAARTDTVRARTLLDAAWKSAKLEGRRVVLDDSAASHTWLFRSTSRPVALLLATTAHLQPKHPLMGALFESVVQSGRSESSRWWNTLDQAAVAEALTAAAATMGLATEREIAVAGPHGRIANVTLSQGRADSLALAIASLNVPVRDSSELRLSLKSSSPAPTYYAMTLFEIPLARPTRADDAGIGVERWYESYDGGKPITEVREGELVRVRLRITAPADREFVVIDDALPAGLEAVDLSLRTSGSLPPFEGAPRLKGDMNEGPPGQRWLYGAWDAGWWTPWEHKEIRDDRVLYFARQLWKGSYQASYVARATTAGTFVRPPAQAEEMYNPAVHGRSDGGTFTVIRAPR